MSITSKSFKLSNGNSIPYPAYGTGTKWFKLGRDEVDENLVSSLVTAIKKGFVHIDGAEIYNTDLEIGKAIKESGVKREDLYITNKYFSGSATSDSFSPEGNPYDSLKAALKKLQIDYVDLYLIHSPFIRKELHGFTLVEAWKYLEKLVDEGYAKNIGVSNFAKEDLEEILNSNPKYKPVINQIEFNAYLQAQTPDIVEFCQKNGILVEAYSPLAPLYKGRPGPLDDTLSELSAKYNKSEAQILLKWVAQKNVLPVTTSSKEERIKSFLDIFDFELTQDEVENITKLGSKKTVRQYWTPEYSKYD